MQAFLQQLWAFPDTYFRKAPRDILFSCVKPYLNPWDYCPRTLAWIPGEHRESGTEKKSLITAITDSTYTKKIDLSTCQLAQFPSRPDILSFWYSGICPGFTTKVIGAVSQDNWLVLWVEREKVYPGCLYIEFWRLETTPPTFHHRILIGNPPFCRLQLNGGHLYFLTADKYLHILPLDQITCFDYLPDESGINCRKYGYDMFIEPRSGDPFFFDLTKIYRLNRTTLDITVYALESMLPARYIHANFDETGIFRVAADDQTWQLSPH